MKKTILPAVALTVSTVVVLLLVPSAVFAQPHSGGTTNETYMVIEIIDNNKTDNNKTDNKIEFKVIAASQFKDEDKRVKDAYTDKVNEWKDLIKTEPGTPHPIKIIIKKIKTGYLTQKIAQEYADKLRDEAAGKGEPKPKDNKQ